MKFRYVLTTTLLLAGCTPEPVEVLGPPVKSVQRGELGCWYKQIGGEWVPQGLPLCDATLKDRANREQTRRELLGEVGK
jgi:hypothetical protein